MSDQVRDIGSIKTVHPNSCGIESVAYKRIEMQGKSAQRTLITWELDEREH